MLGCLVNAGLGAVAEPDPGVHPAYLTHLLPVQLIGGAGVGLTIPSLLAAGSSSLPPARFGTGRRILNMARQVGTVLGVAWLWSPCWPTSTRPTRWPRSGTDCGLIIALFAAAALTG